MELPTGIQRAPSLDDFAHLPCIDQLTSWISDENLKNPRNLYGRALLYNQADIIAATEPQLKGSDIQVENILNIYKGAIDRLHDPRQATQLIDHLALTTGNVISHYLAEGGQSIARSLATVHLQLLAGGSLKVSNASAADVARWAITQAQEQGIKLDTNRRQTRADARAEARSAVKQAKRNQRVIAYELDIPRLEKEGRIAPGTIKGMGIPGIAMAQKWLGSAAPRDFKLGVVTIIVQMMALNFAMKDLDSNDQFNQEETRVKATVAILSLGATIVETVAVTVEKSVEHPLAAFIRNQWFMSEKRAGKIAKWARAVGLLAGLSAASYDLFVKFPTALEEGKFCLAILYVSSGSLSVRIALATYVSLGSLFWPLLILSFAIGIVIALVDASKLKNWISHCEFSTGEKYASFEAQLKGYHDAVGA